MHRISKDKAAEYHRLYGRPHKRLTDAQVTRLRVAAYRALAEQPDDDERDRAMCDIEAEACWRQLPFPVRDIMQTVSDADVQKMAEISAAKTAQQITRAQDLLAAAALRNDHEQVSELRRIIANLRARVDS